MLRLKRIWRSQVAHLATIGATSWADWFVGWLVMAVLAAAGFSLLALFGLGTWASNMGVALSVAVALLLLRVIYRLIYRTTERRRA